MVGVEVGLEVGTPGDSEVNPDVGPPVGPAVGSDVGSAVGPEVGPKVWLLVGIIVGSLVSTPGLFTLGLRVLEVSPHNLRPDTAPMPLNSLQTAKKMTIFMGYPQKLPKLLDFSSSTTNSDLDFGTG
jgi:hypothetical protein